MAVLEGPQDVVEETLLIDAVYLQQRVGGAQGVVHGDGALLQPRQIRTGGLGADFIIRQIGPEQFFGDGVGERGEALLEDFVLWPCRLNFTGLTRLPKHCAESRTGFLLPLLGVQQLPGSGTENSQRREDDLSTFRFHSGRCKNPKVETHMPSVMKKKSTTRPSGVVETFTL